jgi:hypothetical protein
MKSKPVIMVEGSLVRIAATLAGNTVIITDAPHRGASAVNTSCLSRVEFRNWHGEASLGQRSVRPVVLGWSPICAASSGGQCNTWASFPDGAMSSRSRRATSASL